MRYWVSRALLGMLVLFAGEAFAQDAAAPPAARVEVFSPRGSAKQVRQVTARFSVPMVALGDPRLADPFTVDCAAPGKGRWADARNWVYDFDADLPAGLRCRFTLKRRRSALDGRAIAGTRAFAFDTGGPAIQSSFPREGWEAVDEEQVFLLRLDAPATDESVRANAYCVVDGISERVPVEVLSGDARAHAARAAQAARLPVLPAALEERRHHAGARARPLAGAGRRAHRRGEVRATAAARHEDAARVGRRHRALAAASPPDARSSSRFRCARRSPRASSARALSRARAARRRQPITGSLQRAGAAGAGAGRTLARLGQRRAPAGCGGRTSRRRSSNPSRSRRRFRMAPAATLEMPAQLADDAGRALENAARFPLEVRIDEYPPLVKFSGEFGILEALGRRRAAGDAAQPRRRRARGERCGHCRATAPRGQRSARPIAHAGCAACTRANDTARRVRARIQRRAQSTWREDTGSAPCSPPR